MVLLLLSYFERQETKAYSSYFHILQVFHYLNSAVQTLGPQTPTKYIWHWLPYFGDSYVRKSYKLALSSSGALKAGKKTLENRSYTFGGSLNGRRHNYIIVSYASTKQNEQKEIKYVFSIIHFLCFILFRTRNNKPAVNSTRFFVSILH